MESSFQQREPDGRGYFRDILEERRQSSDLSHALRSFNPKLYRGFSPCSTSTLNRTVLEAHYLKYVIQQMSVESGKPSEVIREEAAEILEEMSQNLQLGFVRLLGFILSKVFKRLFHKIYVNDEGLQRLQQAFQEYPVVLMPTHRSYVDFLVLSYILFTYDLPLPVIAAGIRNSNGDVTAWGDLPQVRSLLHPTLHWGRQAVLGCAFRVCQNNHTDRICSN
ncbi:hypothetical protein SKAU_G00192680 [Synaphobranchus kaupii]|uniref:Phospholipid/glycerol acyltransferase domain-containing protein n=1 Tax=Synaphobranchus kaupii TaxID=118154 RepID=A0A9Q1FDY4_SYNKA|nr:hypothetical protein SKAU_G00192680 [Synaphobranchus kaupii]